MIHALGSCTAWSMHARIYIHIYACACTCDSSIHVLNYLQVPSPLLRHTYEIHTYAYAWIVHAQVPSRDGPPTQHTRSQHIAFQAISSNAGRGLFTGQSAMGEQDLVPSARRAVGAAHGDRRTAHGAGLRTMGVCTVRRHVHCEPRHRCGHTDRRTHTCTRARAAHTHVHTRTRAHTHTRTHAHTLMHESIHTYSALGRPPSLSYLGGGVGR